jgi:hypothetical protein
MQEPPLASSPPSLFLRKTQQHYMPFLSLRRAAIAGEERSLVR